MASDIKREIVEILEDLEKKHTRGCLMGALAFLVAGVTLPLLGLLVFTFSALEFQGAWAVGSIIGGLLLTFGIAMGVIETIQDPALEAAATWYKDKFPENSTERRTADRVLACIEQPEDAANSLRGKLEVKSPKHLKQEKGRRLEALREGQRAAERKRVEQAKESVGKCPNCGSYDTYDIIEKSRNEDGILGEWGAWTGLVASGGGRNWCRNCQVNW
ncbi:MAG: hypothetical protein ABIP48_00550 [Planctomycetota bacterium]